MLIAFGVQATKARVIQAGIQFVFEAKGKGTTRTVQLWQAKNKDSLNNTEKDDNIRAQLIGWGLISG